MIQNNRIVTDDSGLQRDCSVLLNDYNGGGLGFAMALTDYIYIGSDWAANHRYFSFTTVNAIAGEIPVIELWNGSQWIDAVDILDGTRDSSDTKSFSQNGIISWKIPKDGSWSKADTQDIPALEDLAIEDLYWARLSFVYALTGSTRLRYIGHKFANDESFAAFYPTLGLPNSMVQFESGKTTWEEQLVRASETVIKDLKYRKDIVTEWQILNWEIFEIPTVHKIAQLVYTEFGKDYETQRENAMKDYGDSMASLEKQIDRNKNTRVDSWEKQQVVFRARS